MVKHIFMVILSGWLMVFLPDTILAKNLNQPDDPTLVQAYRNGGISREDYIISELKTFFDAGKGGAKSKSLSAPTYRRDMTLLLKQAVMYYETFSPEAKAYVSRVLMRPDSTTNTWPWDSTYFYLPAPVLVYEPITDDYPNIGGKYKFWYVTHDTADASGTVHTTAPSFLTSVVEAFEASYAEEVGHMGYTAPLPDTGYSDNGGDEKIDVYLMNCGTTPYQTYGYTTAVGYTGSSIRSSFMVVDNDFSEFATSGITAEEAMQVTVAHEFHHAIQFAINFYAQDWIAEATSAWMESQVYPAVKDNVQYLNGQYGFFANTDISLDDDYYQLYNAWIWLEYMQINWGQDSVRDVWDSLASQNLGMNGVAYALDIQGTTVKTAFTDFTRKNYIQAGFYADAADYDEIQMTNAPGQTLDYSGSQTYAIATDTVAVEHLAAAYYSFQPGSVIGVDDDDTLLIEVYGDPGTSQTASVIVKNMDGSYDTAGISLNASNSGYIYVYDFNQASVTEVVLSLVNYASSSLSSPATFYIKGGLGLTASESGGSNGGGCFIASGM